VKVEADGYVSQQRTIDLAAGHDVDVKVTLAPKEEARPVEGTSTRTIAGWGCVGLAGVALVASGVFALRASSLSDDYADPGNAESFQNPDVRSEGVAFRTGADIALGTALLAGAAATVLLLTDLSASKTARFNRPLLRW
jgi:hypothetical protein